MAVERYIGDTASLAVRTNTSDSTVRINDSDPISFAVSGLIDGNADVIVYLRGQSIEIYMSKPQARQLAELLNEATDI